MLLQVANAVDARLGDCVRGLRAECPDLDVALEPESALELPEGSTFVFVPAPRDATWLNLHRNDFRDRGLRVVLWCDHETTRLLPLAAPDFCDWISHSVDCPPALEAARPRYSLVEATERLRRAGAARPALLAARLDLDCAAVDEALELRRRRYDDDEIAHRLASETPPPRTAATRSAGERATSAQGAEESPFVVGAPLARGARAFVGRADAIGQIRRSLSLCQPVQILGERRMGKTSLLNQVPDWLPPEVPWVLLSAQGHCGTSEEELVRCMAERLGRHDLVRAIAGGYATPLPEPRGERAHRRGGGEGATPSLSAAAALEALVPCALLLDEADALGDAGRAFSVGFFEQCRALGQARRLYFVSAGKDDVGARLAQAGVSSPFLNDARRVTVGQFEPEAREALLDLAPSLQPAARAAVVRQAAGFALIVQAMGDALWRGRAPEAAADQVRNDLERELAGFWERRSPSEQDLLRRAVSGIRRRELTDGERRRARALVERGLLEETDEGFTLPGDLWRGFVRER